MINSLHIARTGLSAQQTALDTVSNNLANVSTTGFKRSRPVFEDLLYQTLRQPGAQATEDNQISSGLQIGTGVRAVAAERLFTQGAMQQTGNALDVAIQGNGFFQIEMADGTTAYTRDGSFQLDSDGAIVTASGYRLAGNLTIPEGALSVTIGKDGIVGVQMAGDTAPTEVGRIQLATFPNLGGLQAAGENLYIETASSGTPTPQTPGLNGAGVLNQMYVEASNVNVAEELVNMITTQRAYEMNSKVITTSDQMLAKLANM